MVSTLKLIDKEAISKQKDDVFDRDAITYELPTGRPRSFSLGRAKVKDEGAL